MLPRPQDGHQPPGWPRRSVLSLAAAAAVTGSALLSPSVPETARARGPAPRERAAPAGDTSRVLEEARLRQRRFERFRRRRLPWTWGRGGPPCDERIGRYCLRMADDGEPWRPPPEPGEVRDARRRLLAHLDSALREAPGSGWLADQRVRYLVEAGRPEEALEGAEDCGAGPARCATLRGFVRHHRGEFLEANRAFRRALALMERSAACRWTSLDVLYREPPVTGYSDASCERRRALAEDLWPLADPLWLVPGNDRRSGQLARRVRDRMQEGGAASPFGDPWGRDLREILLRYGWPVGFEQAHPDVYDATASRPAVAHYPHWGMRYVPPAGAVGSPDGGVGRGGEPGPGAGDGPRWDLEGWDLDPARPRSEYAPPYLREEMGRLEHQVARFRRRDSARVIAAWSWPADVRGTDAPRASGPRNSDPRSSGPAESGGAGSVRDGLFLHRGHEAPLRRGTELQGSASCTAAARHVSAVGAAPGRAVVGLEAFAPEEGAAARARLDLRLHALPAPGLSLSDLLLLAPAGDTVPAELDRAAPCARTSGRLGAGERLGVYWEVYGARGGAALVTELSVRPVGGGLLREVGEFLGLAGEREPLVAASWREPVPAGGGVHRRTVVIRVPPDAEPGSYELGLTVARPSSGGGEAETARRIEIVSGSSRRPAPASRPGPRSPGSAPRRRSPG